MAQAGDAVSAPSQTDSEETRARVELMPLELDDFPLKQSRDEMLKNVYDWIHIIDGQLLQPDQPLSYPYFSLVKVVSGEPRYPDKRKYTPIISLKKPLGSAFPGGSL